ncbi:MAG: tyrosine-protein phosphatase [Bacteroidales bacterium]|nr:tyrosine-protein phosphatase [Bacteroidales bacterium]
MKTRKLLALLLLLPLLTYCDKKNPDPIEDDPIEKPEPGPVDPVDEDPYADAATEVKNGDLILVTNERMQAFLEDVTYPERDYSETHILDEKYAPTAPGNADKPQEYSIRWTKANAEGDKIVKLWEDDGWSREMTVESGEYYVNIINLRPNAHYHYEVKGAGGKTVTSGEFDTKGLVYQVLFKANVRNARDLGGWKAARGKTVKYRMIYRGGRLQPSTLTSKRGKEDLKAQGILAQLDLRGKSDVLSGPTVDYMDFCAPVIEEGYTQMLRDDGAKVKQCFEYITQCVKDNKPVYYHCSLGRDRTGTLTMLLLGVLGVNEGDISKEYELTQFAPYEWATSGGETTKMTRRADYKGAANYIWNNFVSDGETFAQGVMKYLLSIGVEEKTILDFCALMLE